MSQAVANQQHELAGKYRPYPEYKNSGVEWLGEIPAHWDLSRIKYIAQLNPSKSEVRGLSDDTVVSFIPMEAIGERGELDVSRTRLLGDVLTGYSYITNGDVMLAKITPCFENGKGAVVSGLENGIGFATTEVIPARPYRASDAQFLYYLFTSDPFKSLAEGSMYGAGGQKRVADSFVAEYHFAEAPAGERDSIAAFLDYETARIDRLIAKQQQLIELLKEKRQAVISHAVTKGLNPDAPMKDSGVEWLGQVPEHWVASRLKYCTRQIVDGAHFTPTYTDAGVPFLRVTDIQSKHVDLSEVKYIPEAEHNELIKRCNPKKGDLLLSKNGTIGVPKLVDWDWSFSIFVSLCLIKFKAKLFAEYVAYCFESHELKEQIFGLIKQSTVINLHLDKIQNFWICVPPISEQVEIVEALKNKVDELDLLINKAANAIELMQERRTALISAAVTGKIDLRGWTPPTDEVAA